MKRTRHSRQHKPAKVRPLTPSIYATTWTNCYIKQRRIKFAQTLEFFSSLRKDILHFDPLYSWFSTMITSASTLNSPLISSQRFDSNTLNFSKSPLFNNPPLSLALFNDNTWHTYVSYKIFQDLPNQANIQLSHLEDIVCGQIHHLWADNKLDTYRHRRTFHMRNSDYIQTQTKYYS
jgi:hypothetical protein